MAPSEAMAKPLSPFQVFLPELLLQVSGYLTPRENSRLSRVCRSAYATVAPQLWKHLELLIPAPQMVPEASIYLPDICEQHCIHRIIQSPRPILSWVRKLTIRFTMHETSAQAQKRGRFNGREETGALHGSSNASLFVAENRCVAFYRAVYELHARLPNLKQLALPIWVMTTPVHLELAEAYYDYGIDFRCKVFMGPFDAMQGVPKGSRSLCSLRFDVYGNEFATGFFIEDTTDEFSQAHTAKKMARAFGDVGQQDAVGEAFPDEVKFRMVDGSAEKEVVFKIAGV